MLKMIWILGACGLFGAAPVWAVQKCVDSAGQISYQDSPCKGARRGEELKIQPDISPEAKELADDGVRFEAGSICYQKALLELRIRKLRKQLDESYQRHHLYAQDKQRRMQALRNAAQQEPSGLSEAQQKSRDRLQTIASLKIQQEYEQQIEVEEKRVHQLRGQQMDLENELDGSKFREASCMPWARRRGR